MRLAHRFQMTNQFPLSWLQHLCILRIPREKDVVLIRCLYPLPLSFAQRGSLNLDAQPRPRDPLQVTLVGAAHRMLAAISCTQHIRPRVIASQVFD